MITKLDVIIADLGENHDINWFDWVDRRWQITLTLGLLAIAPLARIVRAQTLTLREREYVLAARSIGATTTRVLLREILPNLIPTMLTVAFTGLGILIAAEGALAFLGLSVEAPTPTWGKLIDQNRTAMNVGWWATVFPCLMLFLTRAVVQPDRRLDEQALRHPRIGDLMFHPHSASLRSGEFVERLRRSQLVAAGQQAGLSPQARGLPPPPAPPTARYRVTPRDRPHTPLAGWSRACLVASVGVPV